MQRVMVTMCMCIDAGAVIAANAHEPGLLGIVVCWVGLFAPGILMIYGLMPWWVQFRQLDTYRRYVHHDTQLSVIH